MSYGKWKALHPHTEVVEPENPTAGKQKRCCICGRPISGKQKLYCGEDCAYEAQKIRSREYHHRKKERMKNGEI